MTGANVIHQRSVAGKQSASNCSSTFGVKTTAPTSPASQKWANIGDDWRRERPAVQRVLARLCAVADHRPVAP